MARFKILLILLCVGALEAISGSAVAVSPQWRGTPAPAAAKPAPQRFEMQCPCALKEGEADSQSMKGSIS